ncbi:MAG: sigma-70 family RNA polymerase sigma factor [Ktedonobacterales bacterium]|nr:sigma-70 family RNA polymerase sigma factor [Ktedonobacterales bacterium]
MTRLPDSPPAFAEMLARARRHDADAIAALYQRALPTVYRFVAVRTQGRAEIVEDVVADVFLTMVESIATLRAEYEAGFFAWLLQIAQAKIARAIESQARQRTRQRPLPEDSGEYATLGLMARGTRDDPANLHEWREWLEEVGVALEALTPDQQTVVIGRFLADQSIESLAQVLHKEPGAIRALQFRALGTLAEHLGQPRAKRRSSKGGRA